MLAEMDDTNPTTILTSSINEGQRAQSESASSKLKRKPSSQRSKVWDHFTKFVNEQSDIKARCNYYPKDFYVDPKRNGTTAMKSHMNVCRSRINASDDLI